MAPIDRIAQVVRQAFGGAIADATGELNNAAANARTDVTGAMNSTFGGGSGLISGLLDLLPGIGVLQNFALGRVIGKAGEWILGIASGWALGEFFSEALKPVWNEIIHAIWTELPSNLLDPQTAASMQARNIPITRYNFSDEALGGGIDPNRFAAMVQAAYTLPDLSILLDLDNRGVINDGEVAFALERNGTPPDWINWLLQLKETLLSPADIALAQLRGNMGDAEATAYAARLGVSADDLNTLNLNTGEPPGAQMLMEAVRRGFIDPGRFEHGIRQSRIRNEWIDVMSKLQKHPMTISDAIRAAVQNQMPKDQASVIASENGLEDGQFDILYNTQGRPLSVEQMMALVHRGAANVADAEQAMRESDIKDKYVKYVQALARRLIPERTIVSAIDHGVLPLDQGVHMLEQLGFETADAEVLVKLGVAQRKSTTRVLSRTDVASMYQQGLMKRDDAINHLTALGYTKPDAIELLDLSDVKAKSTQLKAIQRGVEASLKAHHLTREQAKSELIKAGMDDRQATQLLDLWLQERGAPTRSLTQAQIIKAASDQIIPVGDARNRLIAEGLVAGDADILLRIHGLEK